VPWGDYITLWGILPVNYNEKLYTKGQRSQREVKGGGRREEGGGRREKGEGRREK